MTKSIEQLVNSFPSLRGCPGVDPWDALELDAWANATPSSHGELCTVRFVLAVWNPNTEWKCGRFDVMEAFGVWDFKHHQAFMAWAACPAWL